MMRERRYEPTDRASELRERRYQEGQRSFGLSAGPRRPVPSTKLSHAVLDLLPRRSDEWMRFVHHIAPEDVQIWVSRTWKGYVLEFMSGPDQWRCLWQSGDIETFAPQGQRHRVVMLSAADAFRIHQRHQLIDISRNDDTIWLRFRRPREPQGVINAEIALRKACGLPLQFNREGKSGMMHAYTCLSGMQINLAFFLEAVGLIIIGAIGSELWARAKFRRYMAEQKEHEK